MILAALLAAAADVPSGPDGPDFGSLVGSCWMADFTKTMTDTHCFEPMYGGVHIRDRHEVKEHGRIIYAGETIYSFDGKRMLFSYFNSQGGVGRGDVSGAGNILHFVGSMTAAPSKATQKIDSKWRFIDDDHYDVRSLIKSASTNGNKVLHFSRVK